MKLVCAPKGFDFQSLDRDLDVVLFDQAEMPTQGCVGAAVKSEIATRRLTPSSRAWDLLAIALSAVTSDLAGHRDRSPDGWTREYQLTIAVNDAAFWNQNTLLVERLLSSLTTDRWAIRFVDGGYLPAPPKSAVRPAGDVVALLSGGLDSLIGVIDLAASGKKPFVVSELVRGDAEKQRDFASTIGGGLVHLQLHHNAAVPDPETPPSQRARSIVFLSYGVLAATTLAHYQSGQRVTLNICENGFIAINPPLTGMRVGSLSTRTTHPVVLALFQNLLDQAALRVDVVNPYRFKTKGEMLNDCLDQQFITDHAHLSTSCGRFLRYGYQHCGRCVPCLVRRAAFKKWGKIDQTTYKFDDLSRLDGDHAEFDDVRAAAIASLELKELGIRRWLGASLSSDSIKDHDQLVDVAERGLLEIEKLLRAYSVK